MLIWYKVLTYLGPSSITFPDSCDISDSSDCLKGVPKTQNSFWTSELDNSPENQ